jgi:peptide/nickel transport system permease protein
MFPFLAKRALSSVVLAVAVTFITFVLVYSNGPAIARSVLGNDATQEQVSAKIVELGLDQPVLVQYGHWLAEAMTGTLGSSYFTREAVTSILTTRVPVTISIIFVAIVLTAFVSVLIGVAAAVYGGWIDRVLQLFAVLGTAVPGFIIAIGLVIVFSVNLRLFPATGYVPPNQDVGRWLASLVLPVTAILAGSIGSAAQQFRGAVSDVLKQDFVRTIRSRGVPEWQIIFRNVLRSAAGPGLTILGLQTIGLVGGVVIIEQVFAIPGVGALTVTSSRGGDIPVVMGCVLFTVVVVVVVNLIADIVSGWVNPRARIT